MENKDNTESTTTRTTEQLKEDEKNTEEKKDQELLDDEEIINLLKKINIDSEDLLTLVNDLIHFNYELKSLKHIQLILTFDIFNIFKKLNSKDNIKINLILSQIYMNIINNESLYSDYLLSIDEDKTNLLLQIIEECISLIQKLNGFVFDPELYKFKTKTLSFIKCIYYNCKQKITNDIYSRKFQDLLDNMPAQFFSETFNELNKEKELYEICKSEDIDKINNFEDKFAQINNYYEQFDAFKTFVERNSGVVTYASVGGEEDAEKKEEEKKNEIDASKIDFYQQYGLLLLKFCKYHQYVFLNKQNKDAENKEKKEGEEENENENVRVVFLLDKIKKMDEHDTENEKEEKEEEKKEENKPEEETKEENKPEEEKKEGAEEKKETEENTNEQKDVTKGNKKIENLMNEKLFISVTESKEYNELIKKEINNFLKITKSLENEPKLKTVRDQMSYFLSILDIESYVPLYLTDFSKITISDNFTPSFLTNVLAGKTNELYLETRMNETMLVYIEFSLEDKSKDITFEVNKYEINTNSFKPIFKEEKIEDTFKFFILCSGYSLYQIVFNNYYSWFTSKDVNYRIALLKLISKSKKELFGENEEKEGEAKKDDVKVEKEDVKEDVIEVKEEEKEEEIKKEKKDDKKEDEEDKELSFNCDGKNISLNQNEIETKMKDFDKKKEDGEIINIPIILYLNNLRIVTFKKGANDKEEVDFIEKKEDDDYIPKHLFDYSIINYLKKTLKIKPADSENKKIYIQIFSLNRDLSKVSKDIADQIESSKLPTLNNSINNSESINYITKIGFYPSELLEGYKVEYNLYDLCEQSLVYHLFLNKPKKPVLFLQFDKLVVNAALFKEGDISTKLENNEDLFDNIKTNDDKEITDLLKSVNDSVKEFDLVLNYVDNYDEENKKKLLKLFDTVKNYCQEKINPPVKVFVYEQNEIANNVFNYMNLFYNN